eukprot:gene10847-14541_t
MKRTSRLASFCLATLLALSMCGLALAQPDASMNAGNGSNPNNSANTAVAAPPAPTVAELRAQFNKITAATGSNADDDPRKQLAQISDIGAQADKVVAARTGDLADLNA